MNVEIRIDLYGLARAGQDDRATPVCSDADRVAHCRAEADRFDDVLRTGSRQHARNGFGERTRRHVARVEAALARGLEPPGGPIGRLHRTGAPGAPQLRAEVAD